ncbi:hypothetical protein G6011_04372 [Alternaria panax]|uniref:HTH CENPB-type domain-containing protein n=1 Tax=Alternaria panax TaxID=48097 RepID=A0AAD4IGD9_9PLEO|nr:hypothetical protein G6011_04372 [Alternaria panax]
MDPIQKAIEEIESREPGDDFSYNKVAAKYGVELLHPQHEAELVRYIRTLYERSLPPTRAMIQQFAGQLAGKPVSQSWVTRFIHRHPKHLISRHTKGMTKERTKADSGAKYNLYFQLLLDKMKEYDIQPLHIFNMDEKGFQLG